MMYRREIDGLRAVAVLPVILFHGGFPGFSGGYVGVDVFFVISGYLITSILIEDLARDRFSILRFYERRARRILPALFTVVLVTFPFAYAWMLPTAFKDYAQSIAAVALFASNFLFWLESGYFEATAEEKPLLHTWSLAVEEQYYLFFPILLFLLWRSGRLSVFWTIAVLALLSLGLAEWGSRRAPSANFFLLPARTWELFAGSLCALYLHRRPKVRGHNILALAGLGMILASIGLLDAQTPFPSLWALFPVGGTALIVLTATPTTWVGQMLGLRVLVGVGLISYSAYLWHQPLFALARIRSLFAPDLWVMGGLSVLSLVLAGLTWKFVEQPFRRRPTPAFARQRHLFAASLAGMMALIAVGVWGHLSDGRKAAWDAGLPTETRDIYAHFANEQAKEQTASLRPFDDGACRFSSRGFDPADVPRLRACKETHGPGIAIIGDSHSIDIFRSTAQVYPDQTFLFGLHVFGQGTGACNDNPQARTCDFLKVLDLVTTQPDLFQTVVYVQTGRILLLDGGGKEIERPAMTGAPMDEEMFQTRPNIPRINGISAYLAALDAHVRTVWLTPRIEPHLPVTFLAKAGCDYPHVLRPGQDAAFETLEQTILEGLAGTDVETLSQIDMIQFDPAKDILNCGTVFWSDGDHFSDAGEVRFGNRMRLIDTLKGTDG